MTAGIFSLAEAQVAPLFVPCAAYGSQTCQVAQPTGSGPTMVFVAFEGIFPDETHPIPTGTAYDPWLVSSDPTVGASWTGSAYPYLGGTPWQGSAMTALTYPYWIGFAPPGTPLSFDNIEWYTQFSSSGQNEPPIDWTAITPAVPFTLGSTTDAIAASSSLWQSLTLASTSISCAAGDWVQNDVCAVFSYLFVPSPSVIGNFSTLPSQLQTRFPFSWVYGVQTAFEGLTASSTSNFQSATLDLHSLGIGSTTAIGNVLPDVSVLSTTTINTFLPAGMWNTIQELIAASLWLSLGVYIFFETRNRLHRV